MAIPDGCGLPLSSVGDLHCPPALSVAAMIDDVSPCRAGSSERPGHVIVRRRRGGATLGAVQ